MASIAIDARFPKPTRTTASMVVEYPQGQVIAWCCPAPLPLYHPFVPMLVEGTSDPHAYPNAVRRQALTNALLKASPEVREEVFRSARALEARFEARVRPLVENREAGKLSGAITRCQNEAARRGVILPRPSRCGDGDHATGSLFIQSTHGGISA